MINFSGVNFFGTKFFGTELFGANFFWPKLLGTVAIYEPDLTHEASSSSCFFFGFFKSCLFSFAGGWKDSVRNIVVVFQTTSLRIVRFNVRCSAHFFGISFHKLFLASLPPQIPSPLPPTNPPSTLHTHTSPPHTRNMGSRWQNVS